MHNCTTMPKDYKRHLISNLKGDFIEIEKTKYKAKPRVITKDPRITAYQLERDRILWKEGKSIDELKMKYGV